MSSVLSGGFYAFASFKLYPCQRALLRDDDQVSIGGRAFDLLVFLVSRAGTVVSPAELMDNVWPNISVDEANLRVQMSLVRKVLSLCEEAQRAVETVPLRGYCFTLPVRRHFDDAPSERPTRASLPALLSPIVGREDAIEVIGEALDQCQLVSITGPGGIGKSTVAVATANRHRARFDGNIAFVDLSRTNDGQGVAKVVGEALGLGSQSEMFPALCAHLAARRSLLILDTCEHIVEAVARFAEALLNQCAALKLLVTSREALRATGEWTHRLPPLTFPGEGEEINEDNAAEFAAIALFIDRVRWTTRFEVESSDLPVLAEICRRLDGIPLALEFAAARVADLGLRRIADSLDDRFTILTRGRRTALPRHRTLSATLDWSYSLLSSDEQRMLRRLASHRGSFTAEHAHAWGAQAGCEQPREALSSLYEKSLISVDMRDDGPTYRLLCTTRAYVLGLDDSQSSPTSAPPAAVRAVSAL